jgi:glycosyltransferase involved in cell wall biosynthesis
MRLGLVIYGSLATQSGGYLYDRRLVEHLRAAGDEVEIFSLPCRGYPAHLGQNWLPEFRRRLRSAAVDVLLQDELNHPSLFWLNRRLREESRFPLISIVHHLRDSEEHPRAWRPFYRWIERAYLGTLDGAVYNSASTRRAVGKLLGRTPAGVVVTPAGDRFGAGISASEIAARMAAEPPRILFVGNLIPRKGLMALLRALARLGDLGWQLRVAGRTDADPAHSAAVRRTAETLGIGRRVLFLGSLSDADLETEMRQAHLLAVPSQFEGFGIVYLEGMGFGLPAIGAAAGGASEIIADGVSGRLVDPEDIGALESGLRSMLSDRERLLRMSLAARRRFDDFPGWGIQMEKARQFLLGQTQNG